MQCNKNLLDSRYIVFISQELLGLKSERICENVARNPLYCDNQYNELLYSRVEMKWNELALLHLYFSNHVNNAFKTRFSHT